MIRKMSSIKRNNEIPVLNSSSVIATSKIEKAELLSKHLWIFTDRKIYHLNLTSVETTSLHKIQEYPKEGLHQRRFRRFK